MCRGLSKNIWRLTVVDDYVRRHTEISTRRLARQYFQFTRDWREILHGGTTTIYMETEGIGMSILDMVTWWWMCVVSDISAEWTAWLLHSSQESIWGWEEGGVFGGTCDLRAWSAHTDSLSTFWVIRWNDFAFGTTSFWNLGMENFAMMWWVRFGFDSNALWRCQWSDHLVRAVIYKTLAWPVDSGRIATWGTDWQ